MTAEEHLLQKALAHPAPVIFDCGANYGANSLPVARAHRNATVWAFEPTPDLVKHLTEQALPNYQVVPAAVADHDGREIFNVSAVGDWGRSSLNEFGNAIDSAFANQAECCVFTNKLEVECIRLDTFCSKHGISAIHYLHVDTQGSDLIVLKGLGKLLKIVECGVVEVARTGKTKLYRNSPTRPEMVTFLHQNGFSILEVVPNDALNAEQNVFFERSPSEGGVMRTLRYRLAIFKGWRRGLLSRVRVQLAIRTRVANLLRKLGIGRTR